jgi:hypothetical protein
MRNRKPTPIFNPTSSGSLGQSHRPRSRLWRVSNTDQTGHRNTAILPGRWKSLAKREARMPAGREYSPNMVLPGKECPRQESIEQVADATVTCLLRAIPATVPGLAFLSGAAFRTGLGLRWKSGRGKRPMWQRRSRRSITEPSATRRRAVACTMPRWGWIGRDSAPRGRSSAGESVNIIKDTGHASEDRRWELEDVYDRHQRQAIGQGDRGGHGQ